MSEWQPSETGQLATVEWASEADWIAFMCDLQCVGKALRRTGADGKSHHVPVIEWLAPLPSPPKGE